MFRSARVPLSRRFLVALAPLALVASPAAAVEPAPHAATYRLTISGGQGGQAISGTGTALIRAEKACRAWTLLTQMKMTIKSGGQTVSMDMRMAMAETADGRSYSSRSEVTAGGMKQNLKVSARRSGDGGGTGEIQLGDSRRPVAIPKGAVFPITHSQAVMKAALAGQTRHSALVFDAEASGRLMQVVTEIAPSKVPPGLRVPATLQTKKAYRFSFRYFARADTSSQAMPGASVITFGNGVGLLFQGVHGGIRITGKLTKVEALKPMACN